MFCCVWTRLVPIILLEAVSTGRRIISTVMKFSKLVRWASSFMVPLLGRSKWMYLQSQLQYYKPDIMDTMGLLKVYPYIRLYLYIRLWLFLLPFQPNIIWYILIEALLHCKLSMLLVLYQTQSNLRFKLNITHEVQSVHGVMASHINEQAAKQIRNKAISTKLKNFRITCILYLE